MIYAMKAEVCNPYYRNRKLPDDWMRSGRPLSGNLA